jgi:hypothetical protein
VFQDNLKTIMSLHLFNKNSKDHRLIIVLCILAAIRVFIYSAGFPFFNNVDEWAHFDMVMKYAKGHVPRIIEVIEPETATYFVTYNSPEFVTKLNEYPDKKVPQPLWKQAPEKVQPYLDNTIAVFKGAPNPESTQPPLYYMIAGAWARLGSSFGLAGEWLLYWIRFLNVIFAALIVWLAYLTSSRLFPENRFIVLGVPLLAAFMPQDAFYGIQSDVLSPVCFGLAFIGMIEFMRADVPSRRTCILTGLTLASAVLVKSSNMVLVAVVMIAMLYKVYNLRKSGKLGLSAKGIGLFLLCIFTPIFIWFGWNFFNTGDWSGSESKIQLMGWTHKSLIDWFSHPIFTLNGVKTFWSLLLKSFWRGELTWNRTQMGIPITDFIYWMSSLILIVWSLISIRRGANDFQQSMTWLAFGSFISLVLFLAFLSLNFDFGNCVYPSQKHPYFVSGRLIGAAMIPFLLLYVKGLNHAFSWIKNENHRMGVLIFIGLFIAVTELEFRWSVFSSDYNFFHL